MRVARATPIEVGVCNLTSVLPDASQLLLSHAVGRIYAPSDRVSPAIVYEPARLFVHPLQLERRPEREPDQERHDLE